MSYGSWARLYDRLMGDFPSERYLAHVAPVPRTKALDLACGTGRVARMLAAEGLTVHGVDASADMLNVAMAEARKQGLRVTFAAEDMRRFTEASYDLITCVSDGLNYLPPKDIPAMMRRVESSLQVGGRFVFDVSTPHKLRDVLGDNLYYEDYDDLTYFWQNKWNRRTGSVRMELTFFEKEGQTYRRYDDVQVQFAHSRDALETALTAAGLRLESVVDGRTFGRVTAGSERWVFSAVKQGE